MKSSLVLDIIRTHFTGNDADFAKAVERLAIDEDKKGNSALALEIRRAAKGAKSTYRDDRGTTASIQSADIVDSGDSDTVLLIHPDVEFDDLILDREVRTRLDNVVSEWDCRDRLPKGIGPTCRILMAGPPGCGKTMTAKALASTMGMDMAYVRLDGLISQYLGGTGANIRDVFDFVRGRHILLFIDEFDAIAKTRGDMDDIGESKRILTSLLQNMDLLDGNTMLVAATNMPDILDPAVVRRFELTLTFERPDSSNRESMVRMLADRFGLGDGCDLESFVDCTIGMSYAEIEGLFKSMVRYTTVHDVNGPLDATFVRSFVNISNGPRDIWDMRESGMTLGQISNATGIPLSTVGYRIKRGKKRDD